MHLINGNGGFHRRSHEMPLVQRELTLNGSCCVALLAQGEELVFQSKLELRKSEVPKVIQLGLSL